MDALFGFEVDDRPNVNTTDGSMGIDAGFGAVPGDDVEKLRDVVAQMLRRHGRVFHEGQGFGIAFFRHRESQSRLAKLPDAILSRVFKSPVVIGPDLLTLQITFQLVEPRWHFVGLIALQFDDENGGRVVVQEIAEPGCLWIQARAIENVFVNNFHCRRAVDQDRRSRRQSVQQVRKLNAEYGFNLSKDEIKEIVRQAEETERLLRPLNEMDLIDVMPILKVEKKKVKR